MPPGFWANAASAPDKVSDSAPAAASMRRSRFIPTSCSRTRTWRPRHRILVTRLLGSRDMGDAQPQQKPTIVQFGQAVLAPLCRSSITSVDVGDAAGDDQNFCMGQQEGAEGKGFITQRLRVP